MDPTNSDTLFKIIQHPIKLFFTLFWRVNESEGKDSFFLLCGWTNKDLVSLFLRRWTRLRLSGRGRVEVWGRERNRGPSSLSSLHPYLNRGLMGWHDPRSLTDKEMTPKEKKPERGSWLGAAIKGEFHSLEHFFYFWSPRERLGFPNVRL